MTMRIEIPDDTEIKEIVTAAILTHLGQEQRDLLIKQALKELIEPKTRSTRGGYDKEEYIPLHEAFQKAVNQVAKDVLYQQFTTDTEAHKKLMAIIDEAVQQWLASDAKRIVKTIADELSRVVSRISFVEKSSY